MWWWRSAATILIAQGAAQAHYLLYLHGLGTQETLITSLRLPCEVIFVEVDKLTTSED